MKYDLEEVVNDVIHYHGSNCRTMGFPKIVTALSDSFSKQKSDMKLFEYEYVEQWSGICGDDYSGNIAVKLDDGKFLQWSFEC